MDLAEAQQVVELFVAERNWMQFHQPKNLAIALTVESSELLEVFQWLSSDEAARVMEAEASARRVRHELADIFSYLLRIAQVLDVDLFEALEEKVAVNRLRYPIDLARGRSLKYDEL